MFQTALIIEDNARDARDAATLASELGAVQVDTISVFARAAVVFNDMIESRRSAPDLIILDLDFGTDSGFELLRLWKSNPARFAGTRLVVWTVLGEREQKMVRYFGAEVVSKHAGTGELRRVLSQPASAAAE